MSDDKKRPAREFCELLLDAIESGKEGDFELCAAIVAAVRQHRGDEKAAAVRRVLWQMIQEAK
jgi:hypothetical protein